MLTRFSILVSVFMLCRVIQPFSATMARADLLVVRPGGISRAHPAVFRFHERDGTFLNSFSEETENISGLAIGPDENLYVSANTLGDGSVYRFDPNGTFLGTFASAHLTAPTGLRFGPDKNLYVASHVMGEPSNRGQILRYSGTNGSFLSYFVPAGSGGLRKPIDLFFGRDQHLYVADFDLGILRYNGTDGTFLDTFVPAGRGGMNSVVALALGPDGNLYVSNRDTRSILRFDGRDGSFLGTFVKAENGGSLDYASGMTFGPDGMLYLSSFGTHSILRYHGTTGAFLDTFVPAESGGLRFPKSLSFTQSPPKLSIERTARDIVLSWPSSAPNYVLQSTSLSCSENQWTELPSSPVLVGTNYEVTDNVANGARFYRLAKP
jgi:DNA-binding beta-propeller fold protein YncE